MHKKTTQNDLPCQMIQQINKIVELFRLFHATTSLSAVNRENLQVHFFTISFAFV